MKPQTLFYLLLTPLFFLAGCASVPDLLERGELDKAYAVATEPCTRVRARNRTPKPKQLFFYRQAYDAVQNRDLARVYRLEDGNDPTTWPGRYRLYVRLHERAKQHAAILAGLDHDASLNLRPSLLAERRETARLGAGRYYLNQAEAHLPAARRGLKGPARDAFYDVEAARDLLPERAAELTRLLDTLHDTGTLRIHFYAPGNEGYDRTLAAATRRLDTRFRDWTEVTPDPSGRRIDLEAELTFTDYRSSGLQYSSSTTNYSAEVLDYVEKKKKKVKINDSTWVEKIIEIEHYKTVYGSITEHKESIRVDAYAHLAVYRPGRDDPEWTEDLHGFDSWSDSYETCAGDVRALPGCSCPSTISFTRPGEHELVLDALAGLPRAGMRRIEKYYGVPRVR